MSKAIAYHLEPAAWIGGAPPIVRGRPDSAAVTQEVYRTTLPVGIVVKVTREGVFAFDFSAWSPGQDPPGGGDFDANAEVTLRRVEVLNAHLACLYSAMDRRQQLRIPRMVVSASDRLALADLDDFTSYMDVRHPPLWGIDPVPTIVIAIETVEDSLQLLTKILQHPSPHALQVTDLYLRSCKAWEDLDYGRCLVDAWALTEKLLQARWNRYLEENRLREVEGSKVAFINSERKKTLTSSTYTASVITEILSLLGLIPFDLYRDLSEVRSARNRWLHDLRRVSSDEAIVSIRAANRMLRLVDGIDLTLSVFPQVLW
jgi:hypothetical protein